MEVAEDMEEVMTAMVAELCLHQVVMVHLQVEVDFLLTDLRNLLMALQEGLYQQALDMDQHPLVDTQVAAA